MSAAGKADKGALVSQLESGLNGYGFGTSIDVEPALQDVVAQ
jgi:hypothetical protein